jgi:hypothetical protein
MGTPPSIAVSMDNDLDELVIATPVDVKGQSSHHDGWLAFLPKISYYQFFLSVVFNSESLRGPNSSVCCSSLG